MTKPAGVFLQLIGALATVAGVLFLALAMGSPGATLGAFLLAGAAIAVGVLLLKWGRQPVVDREP